MRKRLTGVHVVIFVVAALLLTSCSRVPQGQEPTSGGVSDLGDELQSYRLTIIGTSDLHGALEPSLMKIDVDGDGQPEEVEAGGMPRLATLIRDTERESDHPVVVITSGDELTGRYFHAFKGEATYTLMSCAGYEIGAFGNHEFDRGPDVLAAAVDYCAFDHICTDLAVDGTPLEGLCMPWIIEDYDGLTVGFFSMITESLPYVASPGVVTLTDTNIETARRAVEELHDAGAQLVVCVSHTGLDNDLDIARSVTGIDLIYGGHSHEYTKGALRVGDTFVVNAGTKGPYLVRIDLATDADGRLIPDSVKETLIPVVAPIEPAPDIVAKLEAYRSAMPEATVIGRTDVEWNLSKEAVRGGESTVANLINDSMREKFPVDIVLNNAGAFRGNALYKPGPVTDIMLQDIDEFSNEAYLFDLEGRYIEPILEHSAANFGEGGLLHASGLRYTIDLKEPAQETGTDEGGSWTVTVPGGRLVEVTVQQDDGTWAPLDPDRTYRVLSNSFLVDQEGDGYFWFKAHLSNLENTYSTFASILDEIVANEGVLNPAEPDGRLKVIR
ncbi:MAG: 5'-nucleotidase C-terminal domain-containing protein [Candidatus Eisenbacteria bacterium]|nr:5'-nucleotidase C-terminal domain-containing protein [Candidatus Eisenbacteria bacterium]